MQMAGENLEQQIEGRTLFLSWDTQSILNFALSRMAALQWFRDNFPEAIRDIDAQSELLAEGTLPTGDCEEILLKVFPHKVRRHNLLTLTFLKTYFSEGEGEAASFYPPNLRCFLERDCDAHHHGVCCCPNRTAGGWASGPADDHLGSRLRIRAVPTTSCY